MSIKRFFKEKVLGIPSFGRELIVELPSEEEKRKIQQIRLQNEKIKEQAIKIRNLEKELKKIKHKEEKEAEEKILIKTVLKEAKKKKKEIRRTKAIYRLVYPSDKPYIQYANGKRRIYDGFEINETKEGIPLFRLRFYSDELKKIIPLQLDAQELTFFFKSIIGLPTQHNTGIIPLNVDEVEGKPVFIKSEIGFLKEAELQMSRLARDLARKDDEIRMLRGKVGTLNELQAEQEKDLADREMALRYAEKDSENKAAKLESVMQINLATTDKLRTDHIGKGMSELKMAQSLRTLHAFEQNNEILNQKLAEAYSSEAYERGKEDVMELQDKIIKQMLSVQSATKAIQSPSIRTVVKQAPKEEKKLR